MFVTKEDFRNTFGVPDAQYFDSVILSDGFGFSVKRHYPERLRFDTANAGDGKPAMVAVHWVVLEPANENGKRKVSIRTSAFDRRSSDNFYPDDSPSSTIHGKKRPLELAHPNEFYYDPSTDKFYHRRSLITPRAILEYAFDRHCATAQPHRMLEYYARRGLRVAISFILLGLMKIFSWLLRHVFQHHVQSRYGEIDRLSDQFSDVQISPPSPNKISFLGLEAEKISVVLLSILIVTYCLLAKYLPENIHIYFKGVEKHPVQLAAHLILLLTLLEVTPTKVLYPILNGLINLRTQSLFRPVTVFSWWLKPTVFITLVLVILFFARNAIPPIEFDAWKLTQQVTDEIAQALSVTLPLLNPFR